VPEAQAGIAFQSPYFGYNKRQTLKSGDPPDIRTFTQRLVNALLRVAQVGGHRFVLDTDTLADLTFRCEGYSDSLLGEAR
jgi:hypothetical protein